MPLNQDLKYPTEFSGDEVRLNLGENHNLWIKFGNEGYDYFEFILTEFSSSMGNAERLMDDPVTEVDVIWSGNFTVGELRHTYFYPDEDGYGFYPNIEVLRDAMGILMQIMDVFNEE